MVSFSVPPRTVSRPWLPAILSAPSPPMMVSLPLPPEIVSLPAPPSIVSLAPFPSRLSSPSPPSIVSSPSPPFMVSAPSLPKMLSAPCDAFILFARLFPIRVSLFPVPTIFSKPKYLSPSASPEAPTPLTRSTWTEPPPELNNSVSMPAPPSSVSAPAPPFSVSLPSPPKIDSLLKIPFKPSSSAEPIRFSAFKIISPWASPPLPTVPLRNTVTPAFDAL